MSAAKKIKMSEDFTERGRYDDEITLKFDDGKELFVSKSFLCMASPVFNAMLSREFKETKTKRVELVGKKYVSFLHFLECIHPAVMAPVTLLNVLKVTKLAEEYQHDVLILRCKELMTKTLNNINDLEHILADKSNSTKWKNINFVTWMLTILHISNDLNYDDIKQLAIECLGKCSHIYYCGSKWKPGIARPEEAKREQANAKKIYQSLPETLKNQVLIQRLDNAGC